MGSRGTESLRHDPCAGYVHDVTNGSHARNLRDRRQRVRRILVCGGRDYADADRVAIELDQLHRRHGIDLIIEGGARGADSLAREWAATSGVACMTVNADWKALRRAAGPIRNQRMIDQGKPDLVMAFPGGRGTADTVRRAKAAGIEVVEVASR
jgi:hypothetical protein